MSELKPCPFCGAAAEEYQVGDLSLVRCTNLDCWVRPSTNFQGAAGHGAITVWNRRQNPLWPDTPEKITKWIAERQLSHRHYGFDKAVLLVSDVHALIALLCEKQNK